MRLLNMHSKPGCMLGMPMLLVLLITLGSVSKLHVEADKHDVVFPMFNVPMASVGSLGGPVTPLKDKSGECSLTKIEYAPANIESVWSAHVKEWDPEYCKHVFKFKKAVTVWLKQLNVSMAGQQITFENKKLHHIFSRHVYTFSCPDGRTLTQAAWMEPLFGSLRHPLSHCDAEGGSLSLTAEDPNILSRAYLLLGSVQSPTFLQGRMNIFIDLGASTYYQGTGGVSQDWFISTYKLRGIEFDRVLLWEAGVTYPESIFSPVPPDLFHAYQYFNIPVDADVSSQKNPLNIIRRIVKAEDFLVVKIDIDNSPIEEALVAQIVKEPAIHLLIDEMFYEHHVNFAPMHGHWTSQAFNVFLHDSYRTFGQLRKLGIRMHGWP